jgi:DNA-binding transcriptional LysR family regulator
MNILGLKAFSRIMAAGTLTAAARSMNISPSALSRQIAVLEAELGLKLFRREKQRLVATEEGEDFYNDARRLLASIEQVPEIVKQIKSGYRKRLSIIVMPRLAPAIAVPAITEYMKSEPDVHVMIDIQQRRMVERWIANSMFDLGLGPFPAYHRDVEVELLGSVPPVVVVGPEHRLAGRKLVHVEELAGEEIVGIPNSLLIGSQVAEIFEDAGVPLRPRLQVAQSAACCNFVASGAGVTVTDAMSPLFLGDRVVSIPLETRIKLDFGLIFPRGVKRREEVNALAATIRRHSEILLERITPACA